MLDVLRDVQLTVAGNRAIGGSDLPALWPDHAVFVFTRRCAFVDQNATVLADNPNVWLADVAGSHKGLWLHWVRRNGSLPDWIACAWANGGSRWIIEAKGEVQSELWEARSRVVDDNSPDRKSWETVYTRIAADWRRPLPLPQSIGSAGNNLQSALRDTIAFAKKNHVGNSESLFTGALAVLDGSHDATSYTLYRPEGLATDASILLAGAQAAFQFGGMGSWSDQVFDGADKQPYERVSRALYEAICGAVTAAANSTFP
jgi:hypothetical protein